MSIEITKVRIMKTKKGEGLQIIGKKVNANREETEFDEKNKGLIHPDLKRALDSLKPHLAALTGYYSPVPQLFEPNEKVETFFINGYSIGGGDENAGVVVSGHHILKNGLSVTLNSPFTKFNIAAESDSRYKYVDDLQERLKEIDLEVVLYLDGKRGAPVEQELPFAEEDKPAKKNGQKKKVKQTAEHPNGEMVEG